TLEMSTQAPWGTLPWGAPNWWTGIEPWPNYPERKPCLFGVSESTLTGRYWRCEINDPDNPDGYVEAGRLFMSSIWRPEFNYAADNNGFGIEDNARHVQMLSGARRSKRRLNPRFFSFTIEQAANDAVFGPYWKMIDLLGY